MKRILSILTVALAILALVACGSKPKGSEVVIANFLDKVKSLELDEASLSPYIFEYTDQLDTFNRIAMSPGFSESKMFFNIYFGNMTYKFKGQEMTDEGTLVTTEIRNVGTAAFMERLMNEVLNKYLENSLANMEKLNGASEEEKEAIMKESEDYLNTLIKGFKVQNSDFLTNEVVFLVKADAEGMDKIVLADKVAGDNLIATLIPSPQEESEEEMIVEADPSETVIIEDANGDVEMIEAQPAN